MLLQTGTWHLGVKQRYRQNRSSREHQLRGGSHHGADHKARSGAIGPLQTRKRTVCLKAVFAGDELGWCVVRMQKNGHYPKSLFLGESHERFVVVALEAGMMEEVGLCR